MARPTIPTRAFRTALAALVLATPLLTAGCGKHGGASGRDTAAPPTDAVGQGYLSSPAVSSVAFSGANLLISGSAAPGARINLTPPGGTANTADADDQGRWSLSLPAPADPQVFGLSMVVQGRRVQGQGYVLLTPKGQGALLRAGAGAVRLDPLEPAAIGTIDIDQAGGVVVSGTAPAGAVLALQVDGHRAIDGRADKAGRYSVAAQQPLTPGPHHIQLVGDGFEAHAQVDATRAEPLAAGPLRSQLSAGGLRADWMTPGGGVQSTLIVD